MELNTQTIIRTIIPGLIIYIVFFIVQCNSWDELKQIVVETEISLTDGWSFIIIIFVGIFYHIIGIRSFIWRPIKKRLQDKVEEELSSAYKERIDDTILNNIRRDRKIIDQIFYPLINDDENLKVQSRFIFFNGAILTSIIDLITILIISSIYLILKYLIIQSELFTGLVLTFGIVILIALFFLFLTTKRHFKLSEGEINYILTMKKTELYGKFDSLISAVST